MIKANQALMTLSKMSRQVVVILVVLCSLCRNFVSCGTISGRIVGGSGAFDVNLPWMVSIQSYGKHVCGGSIINKKTILTAAHCLAYTESSLLKVRVGSKAKSVGGQLMAVDRMMYNLKFKASTMDFDIGIIRLVEELVYSPFVQPIALPHYGEDVPEGAKAIVSGWGYYTPNGPQAEYLQYAVVPIMNQATCNRLLKNGITDQMVCAGYISGGIDACTMDSGGPLVVNSKLVGIVSWGISCALPNKPGVYTRVSELVPWVADYLKNFDETL